MTALSALAHGLGTVKRTWRWMLVAVAVNLALAIPAALWIGSRVDGAVAGRADSDRFAGTMDADALGDLRRVLDADGPALAWVLGAIIVLAAVVRALFDAGIAGVAAHEPRAYGLSAIGRRAARLGRRFIVLLLPAAAAVLLARLLLDGALGKWWHDFIKDHSTADSTTWMATRARELITVGAIFMLGRVSDAARGLLALDPTRSAWAAWCRGLVFVRRHPVACAITGGVPAVFQVAAVTIIGAAVGSLESDNTASVLIALLAFQGLMLLRECCHALSLAAMVGLVGGHAGSVFPRPYAPLAAPEEDEERSELPDADTVDEDERQGDQPPPTPGGGDS